MSRTNCALNSAESATGKATVGLARWAATDYINKRMSVQYIPRYKLHRRTLKHLHGASHRLILCCADRCHCLRDDRLWHTFFLLPHV